jgi:hypothetical protein
MGYVLHFTGVTSSGVPFLELIQPVAVRRHGRWSLHGVRLPVASSRRPIPSHDDMRVIEYSVFCRTSLPLMAEAHPVDRLRLHGFNVDIGRRTS